MDLPEHVAQMFGVSRMPLPLQAFETHHVVRRLPKDFARESEHVTIRLVLDLDDTGTVTQVEVVPSPSRRGVRTIGVLTDEAGAQPIPEHTEAPPALRDAVVEAARRMRFRPAERDGRAVPVRGIPVSVHYTRDELVAAKAAT